MDDDQKYQIIARELDAIDHNLAELQRSACSPAYHNAAVSLLLARAWALYERFPEEVGSPPPTLPCIN
jgi:hypothetical protein